MNAMSYADIDNAAMSHATSLYTVVQHLSLARRAWCWRLSCWRCAQYVRGDKAIEAADFSIAFVVVALIAVTSVWQFTGLSADAGSAVSGKGARVGEK